MIRANSLLQVLVLLVGFTGCTTAPLPGSRRHAERLHSRLLDEWLVRHPASAVSAGLHSFDGQFLPPTAARIDETAAWAESALHELSAINIQNLPMDLRQDHRLLEIELRKILFESRIVGEHRKNPMKYTDAMDVSLYIKRNYAPLEQRVASMTRILSLAPELFSAARNNLNRRLPAPFTETAISQAEGAADFIEKDVKAIASKSGSSSVNRDFSAAAKVAVKEFREFAKWLKTDRQPHADATIAIGRPAYMEMLGLELVSLTPEEVLEIGMKELAAEQARFADAARDIDPSVSAPEVYRRIQREHPTAASLLPDTRRTLEDIRKFVVDRNLVTIPSEVRARVEETLPPFRATSFASMETPGPYETKATEAYYYVTPVEPDWPAARQEEWLSAFNYYTTDVVSIHEAYPGHYVQFLAVNASKASRISKMFTSYAFSEGWAHYTEEMMLDEGFGQPEPGDTSEAARLRGAKYRLAQSGEALLRLCRLCASVRLHVQGASVEEMTRFFVENCHYEAAPALAEATRGTFDPQYCLYSLGKLQLRKLRSDWHEQEGNRFSLRRFHDELLAHGSPPFRILRERMLKDPRSWDAVL